MLFSVARRVLWWLSVLVAFVLVADLSAQQATNQRAPSDLIEVAEYLSQADAQMTCDPATARLLAQRAISRLSELAQKDELTSDTAAQLRAQANLSAVTADRRVGDLRAAEDNARKAVNEGRLDTATNLLRKADPTDCYGNYRSVRADIDQRRSEAARMIAQGDEELATRPKDAAQTYQRASRVNREAPELDAKLQRARAAEEATRVRRPLPWRRVYGHASFPMFLYSPSSSGGLAQTIYNRAANLSYSKTTEPYFGRVEFGVAGRLVAGLGLGFTYTDSERTVSTTLSGTIPARTATFSRVVSNMILSTVEAEKGYHVEVRGQFGSKAGEVAIFAGPSFIDVNNGLTSVAVQELTATGNGAFTLSAAPATTEHRLGFNFGADFSGYVGPVIGFGGGIRYVYSRNEAQSPTSDDRQSLFASIGLRLRL